MAEEQSDYLERLRHSAAHVMTQAHLAAVETAAFNWLGVKLGLTWASPVEGEGESSRPVCVGYDL